MAQLSIMIQAREILNQTHPDNCPKSLFPFIMWTQVIKYFGKDYVPYFKAVDSQDEFYKSDLSSLLIQVSSYPGSLAPHAKL